MFLRARRSIKTTTDLNHEAIINAYMRLSTFLEIGLSNNIDDLNTVVEFTSHDLFKQKWYEGEAQKSTLCGNELGDFKLCNKSLIFLSFLSYNFSL